MEGILPDIIVRFESFLLNAGLACKQREGPDPKFFGNQLIQYGDGNVGLQIVSDRSEWTVSASDTAGRPNKWYDADLLRDLLFGERDDALTLDDQISFFERNWPEIVGRFTAGRRGETHAQLTALGIARSKRLFGWPT